MRPQLTIRPALTTLDASVTSWANRVPEAIAVESPDGNLSYAALCAGADSLAQHLRELGVSPGGLVAVIGPPGARLVTAMLGVLRADAAFMVFGPADPTYRVAQALGAVKPTAFVAVGDEAAIRVRSAWGGDEHSQISCEPDVLALAAPSTTRPVHLTELNVAYVAFTSGSSGMSKGVVQTHDALFSWVRWQSEYFGLGPGSRVAQLAPPGFDVQYCETFGALCFGATLAIPPSTVRDDLVDLARWLAQTDVSLLQMVPSHLAALVRTAGDNSIDLTAVRQVAFVGEALTPFIAELVAARLPQCRIFNLYGPTETVAATCQPIVDVTGPTIPIGEQVADRIVSVRRQDHALCAPGEPGEICISGRGIAVGYIGAAPNPSPFCEVETEDPEPQRHYHTGDRGCLRDDGRFEFLGRFDRQVKVRGQRVEPAEIEAVLAQHRGVRAARVELVASPRGSEQLVALVEAEPTSLSSAMLRSFAAERLPKYMVPQRIEVTRSLPRTARGKTDVAAVRRAYESGALASATEDSGALVTPSYDEIATEVLNAWRAVLGIEDIEDTADFNYLGGESLKAMEIVGRLRQRLARQVPLRWVFEHPTVRSFSQTVMTEWQSLERDQRDADD